MTSEQAEALLSELEDKLRNDNSSGVLDHNKVIILFKNGPGDFFYFYVDRNNFLQQTGRFEAVNQLLFKYKSLEA